MPGPMMAELMFSLDDCVFKAVGFILGNLECNCISTIDFLQDYMWVIRYLSFRSRAVKHYIYLYRCWENKCMYVHNLYFRKFYKYT